MTWSWASGAFSNDDLTTTTGTSTTVSPNNTGTGVLRADDGSGHTDDTGTFTVNAGVLANFEVDAPASGTAGVAFSVTITAKDSEGNTTTDVSGATALSVDDGTIDPASIAEVQFTDDGVWTGDVTLTRAGSRTITATNGSKTGSDTIDIDPGPLDSFEVDAPASGRAGTVFSVTITAKDADGNTTTQVSGATALSVDDGTIDPTSIAEAQFTDDGVWTGDVTLTKAGSRTITATNSGKTGSDAINIAAGELASFEVDAPTSGIAGVAFSVTITAKDSESNITTDISGATALSVDDGTIDPASLVETEFTDDGIWTGNVTLGKAGARTITATNDGKTGSDTIDIEPGPLASFEVDAPASGQAGVAFSVTITAKDSEGNTTTDVSGATALSVDDGTIDPASLVETEFTDDGIWTG
nr:hypothetical protein [Anaerolineales bacterium]